MKISIVLLMLLLALPILGTSQDAGEVWVLTVDGAIGRGTASYLRQGISKATEAGALAVVIVFSTPGGTLDAAVTGRDAILGAEILTIAFVDREAFSAGALLAIACERIYFSPGGVIGAATPVFFDQGRMEEAPEKVVSAVRKLFRATAEARGRPPEIAEAMVDRDVEIEGLIERGKLLTLTSLEAEEWGYFDGEVASLAQLLEKEGLAEATVVHFDPRFIDTAVAFLTLPLIAALLITAGLIGLVMEMLAPGFGLPGIIGLGSLGAFFWSHFLIGFAGWESLLFLVAGLALILVEIFVLTGSDFGVAGLLGLVLAGLGFYTAMVGPFTDPAAAMHAIGIVSGSLVLALVGIVILVTRLPHTRFRFGGMVLSQAITGRVFDRVKGQVVEESPWIGRQGVAATVLRPVGSGEFAGERTDVVCEEGFLPEGTPIVVIKDEAYRKVVRKIEKG